MRGRFLFALFALAIPAIALCQHGKEMPPLAVSYPGGVRTLAGIPYRVVDGQELVLDLYLPPESKAARPTVLFVHGGGFVIGHRRMMGAATDFPERLAALAAKGYVVASMEYRFSPKAFFPAQIQDAKAAVAWLRDHADAYGIDRERIAIWGSSAGATIAATVALGCGDPALEPEGGDPRSGKSCVQAAADWFGPASIEAGRLSMIYLGCGVGTSCAEGRLEAASPVARVSLDAPPFQILHGDADTTVPLEQSLRFAQALRAAGDDIEFHVLKGVGHGLHTDDAATQTRVLDDAMAALTGFLDRTIGVQTRSGRAVATGKEER